MTGSPNPKPQHREDSHAHVIMYPMTAAVRYSCTRSVVLCSGCLVPVICGVGNISEKKHYPWHVPKYTASTDSNCKNGLVYTL